MATRPHLIVDDFSRTSQALEAGLLVHSIMSYPLATVAPDDDAAAFFRRHEDVGFDCAPVQSSGRIIGMVYRADLAPEARASGKVTASTAMRALEQVPLVAASESIAALIRAMRTTNEHFWLVLDGTNINAIVTRSDLWRLPVRLLAMGRVVHLEQLLTEVIRLRAPGDAWLKDLRPERQQKIRASVEANRARNEHLEPLESTNFSDKLEIIRKTLRRPTEADNLGGLNALRDQLMHARDGDDAEAGIAKFLQRLDRLDSFIVQYTLELSPPLAARPGIKE